MSDATQMYRQMSVNTPLGPDAMLIHGFEGDEGISTLFHFTLDLVAPLAQDVLFDRLLGQPLVVRLDYLDGSPRLFHGICNNLTQGESDQDYKSYQLEMVPAVWVLTRRIQTRVFQHESIVDILKKVLDGFEVEYNIQGTFHPRDYVCQYRESDWDFACRQMEEEGIYYYFTHSDDGHKLVLANTPGGHEDTPFSAELIYHSSADESAQLEDYIQEWSKSQSLTSGKYTLWDHCFEMTGNHLESERPIQDAVDVGGVSHKLKVGQNDKLEIYDYPGEYAQRFDGVDKEGGEQPAELEKIFEDNARTVGIRMQQEAAQAILIKGRSTYRQIVSGHKFTLLTLPLDPLTKPIEAEGQYVMTKVSHYASVGSDYRSGDWSGMDYSNTFESIPFALPFRPARMTSKPTVSGSQTATVVGPAGEEIYTDKYGRVKVQFQWDREGAFDVDSACWLRVGSVWAGAQFGMIHIPRIGQEVIVDFLEGDPDQPIIVGSVYNDQQLPALTLPDDRMVSGFKSNSYPGGGGYNSLFFNDSKGNELISMHGEKDRITTIDNDDTLIVHHDMTINVDGKHTETIDKDTKITVTKGKLEHKVADNTADYYVEKDINEKYNANQTTTVTKDIKIYSTKKTILLDAAEQITLNTGESQIVMMSDGTINITGKKITIKGTESVRVDAPKAEVSAAKEAKIGVGKQNMVCDTTKVAVSGANINSSAVGMHEITGALVKIN